MPCCGQKRGSLKTNAPGRATGSPAQSIGSFQQGHPANIRQFRSSAPATASAVAGPQAVLLQYTQTSHIVVEGPVTRRRYEFSAAQPMQRVDSNDAAALLATRFFIRR